MHAARDRLAILILCAPAAACAGRTSPKDSSRVDGNVITQEQIIEHHFTNAYEAVEALHSNWFQTRGADSFRAPTQVQVYLDDTRLGGIETLRSIATAGVVFIRYYDGVTATARWGLDHGQGVIFVSTRS